MARPSVYIYRRRRRLVIILCFMLEEPKGRWVMGRGARAGPQKIFQPSSSSHRTSTLPRKEGKGGEEKKEGGGEKEGGGAALPQDEDEGACGSLSWIQFVIVYHVHIRKPCASQLGPGLIFFCASPN